MDERAVSQRGPAGTRAPAGELRPGLAGLALRVTDACLPRGAHDPAFLRRARTAVGISFALILTTVLAAGAQLCGFGDLGGSLGPVLAALNLGGAAVAALGLVLLRRRGALALEAHVVTGYFVAFNAFAAYATGGSESPVTYCLLGLPLAILLVVGRGAAAIWMGIVLLDLLGLYALHASGHVFPAEGTRAERDQFWLLCLSAVTALVFMTVWAFDRARGRALATLEDANRQLERARRAADAANESQGAFLATMSHEIRTPLTAVLGFADVTFEQIADAAVSDDDRLAVATIGQSARSLLKIVDDLLDLSNIEAGRVEIRPTRCHVDPILDAVGALLGPQAEAQGTPLRVERAAGAPDVLETDAGRLQQVLVNLVGNAIKFSSSGVVRLGVQPLARAGEAWIRFEVSDSGIGMTAEQVGRLFQPFSQAEASTARRYGGTGLGLSMSAVLVESMSGEISVQSQSGQGSSFRVDLPIASPQRPAPAEPRPAVPRVPVGPDHRLEARVLVVDDTRDNRRLIKHFLDRAGAEVTTAEGGEEALRLFQDARQAGAPHDVIVMDIQMPGMDGFAARRALREAGCRVPIIALTAHAMGSERTRCLAAGFSDYASKPIDRASLIEFVARNLASAPRERPAEAPAAPAPDAPLRARLARQLETLVEWFVPPRERDNPLALRRTRLLLGACLAPVVIFPFEVWAMLQVWPREIAVAIIPLALAVIPLCAALPFVYRWSASVAIASNALAAYATALVAVLTYFNGGPGSPVPAWHALVPMVACAITGLRSGALWLCISLAIEVGFFAAALAGVPMPNHIPTELLPFGATMSNIGIGLLISVVAMVHERATSDALDTLTSANRWLQEARRRAERAGRTKTMFLANISHELRTPMTAILGFADLLITRARSEPDRPEALGPAALDSLETIRRSGQRLLALINDLLDLAKVEAGSLRIEALEVQPARLIAEVLEPLRAEAEDKGLELVVYSSGLPRRMVGDPLRIRQILAKLCDNAIKFTRHGSVSVSAQLRGQGEQERLCIAVTDTGCGIPQEHLPTLFTAFHQVDSSAQRERGGSGLGLALCRRLAERMGGAIHVTSEVGHGSRFELELPLRELEDPPEPPDAADSRESTAGAPLPLLELRLLLAEDGADNQRLIARVLRDAGAAVDVVDDGELAVHRSLAAMDADQPYDLILMDVEMPRLDGLRAASALREADYAGPILAFTAHDLTEEHDRCIGAGCDGVAAKPVHWPTLFAQIQSLCADRKPPLVYAFGDPRS